MLSAPSPPYRFTVANLVAKKWSNSCVHHTRHTYRKTAVTTQLSQTHWCVVKKTPQCPSLHIPETDVSHPEPGRKALPRTPDSSWGCRENNLRGRITSSRRSPSGCVFFQSRGHAQDFCCLSQNLSFSARFYSTIFIMATNQPAVWIIRNRFLVNLLFPT